jgi:hypothetical protein
MYCTFTKWTQLAGGTHFYDSSTETAGSIGLRDCQFFSGIFTNNGPAAYITNCLFQRVAVSLGAMSGGYAVSDLFNNNLMVGGTLALQESNSGDGPWSFQNNLFDHTTIPTFALATDNCNSNAYITTNAIFTNFYMLTSVTNPGTQILSNSPAYEVGPLGQNYYPAGFQLINAGSMTAAAAGLFHYTVVTATNTCESNSVVSIGFHYVAVDAYGNPLDTNGDGVPDYLEDSNGNGLVDSGEVAWNVLGDLGLQVWITQPGNNTKIP